MKLRSPEGFRFVAGEILVTTIGILIALGANAAWQNHQDRITELRSLREISQALQNDRADLTTDLARYHVIDRSAKALLVAVSNHAPYQPSFDTLFLDLYDYRIHVGNPAPFQALQSAGIDVVAPDSLRLALLHFYSVGNDLVRVSNEIDNKWIELNFTPYLDRHLPLSMLAYKGDSSPRQAAYATVARDPYFAGLLAHRAFTVALGVRSYEMTIAEASALLRMIARRINELE